MAIREDFIARLNDERAFKEEIFAIEKIVEFEERKRKRLENIDFE